MVVTIHSMLDVGRIASILCVVQCGQGGCLSIVMTCKPAVLTKIYSMTVDRLKTIKFNHFLTTSNGKHDAVGRISYSMQ